MPLELHPDVKHDRRGILSMARNDDPNSGGSSFSLLLGPAPHLDQHYAVFGEVVEGIETLARLEELPPRTEGENSGTNFRLYVVSFRSIDPAFVLAASGIFVMPIERITISSTYT